MFSTISCERWNGRDAGIHFHRMTRAQGFDRELQGCRQGLARALAHVYGFSEQTSLKEGLREVELFEFKAELSGERAHSPETSASLCQTWDTRRRNLRRYTKTISLPSNRLP
jgi:hypothetical protein